MSLSLASDKREEFDEPEFALIDTLFSLAEAHLFMQVGGVGSGVFASGFGAMCALSCLLTACWPAWRRRTCSCRQVDVFAVC